MSPAVSVARRWKPGSPRYTDNLIPFAEVAVAADSISTPLRSVGCLPVVASLLPIGTALMRLHFAQIPFRFELCEPRCGAIRLERVLLEVQCLDLQEHFGAFLTPKVQQVDLREHFTDRDSRE